MVDFIKLKNTKPTYSFGGKDNYNGIENNSYNRG